LTGLTGLDRHATRPSVLANYVAERDEAEAYRVTGAYYAKACDENRGDTPAERLLWTPTEGQDLTKSYFPLSEPPVLAACDECGEEAPWTVCGAGWPF
jgi:hypothetical protein